MEENNENLSQNPPALQSSEKQGSKQGNGSKFTIIILAILAIAGLGFGIYEMTEANKAKQLADKTVDDAVDIKEDSKTSDTSDTTDKITSLKTFGFTSDNLISGAEYTVPAYPPDNTETMMHTITLTTPQESARYRSYNLKADGQLEAYADILNARSESDATDITSKFPARVVDIAFGQIGNGGVSWLIALLEDGTLATLEEPWAGREFSESASKVEGASDIVKIYGNFTDALSILGYAQDTDGKIHNIVLTDTAASPWSFKLSN